MINPLKSESSVIAWNQWQNTCHRTSLDFVFVVGIVENLRRIVSIKIPTNHSPSK